MGMRGYTDDLTIFFVGAKLATTFSKVFAISNFVLAIEIFKFSL